MHRNGKASDTSGAGHGARTAQKWTCSMPLMLRLEFSPGHCCL